ncbi:MAG: selenocysteine synthase, partial [Gemmatimonadetes bacterium]|nr:selenocysteine synthase [Gemmatimonadota bacterium]NIR80743.1 selenocysteine synthase [Gemmatimonadota bacterium]NIT89547.1 selenocysteine synthase [Gemmatimonadota bacterium]NIU33342.1 selenocysteine synthase [Gemmatimonadota bacterium]NIU37628.1 selenocysteine synthase [Gemmatimonadota bacterium]
MSGGKALRAPPSTGLLCGRGELVASAAVQSLDTDEPFELWDPPEDFIPRERLRGLPRQGVGRGFKVSPAQVLGFLVALERRRKDEGDGARREGLRLLESLARDLSDLPVRA